MLRFHCVFCVVLLSLPSFASARESPDNAKLIVGKWEAVKAEKNGNEIGSTVEFFKGRKVRVGTKNGSHDFDGTYSLDGNKINIVLKIEGRENKATIIIIKLSDTEAIFEANKAKTEYKRIKSDDTVKAGHIIVEVQSYIANCVTLSDFKLLPGKVTCIGVFIQGPKNSIRYDFYDADDVRVDGGFIASGELVKGEKSKITLYMSKAKAADIKTLKIVRDLDR